MTETQLQKILGQIDARLRCLDPRDILQFFAADEVYQIHSLRLMVTEGVLNDYQVGGCGWSFGELAAGGWELRCCRTVFRIQLSECGFLVSSTWNDFGARTYSDLIEGLIRLLEENT